jgi:RNA polymerase sigma-70 factor (ECF subfamily)
MRQDDMLDELARLYEAKLDTFVRAAHAITRNHDAARDAVQDGFASAVAHRHTFHHGAALETWVWRIIIRKALDRCRQDRRAASAETMSVADATPLQPSGNHGEITRALRDLPERQRLAVFLRYYADLDYMTIADVLDVRPGTVGASLSAARQKLKVRLTSA